MNFRNYPTIIKMVEKSKLPGLVGFGRDDDFGMKT